MTTKAFSMIELLIVVALGGLAMGYVFNTWKSSKYLNKVLANDNDLQLIEEDLRNSILDEDLLGFAATKNNELNDCFTENNNPCNTGIIKGINLFNARGINVTGAFYEWGKPCSSGSCPIEVAVEAVPRCEGPNLECEKAIFINFTYRIMLTAIHSTFANDGTRLVYRKSTLRVAVSDQKISDTSSACDLTADGRPSFASSIERGVIYQSNCLVPPGRTRIAENIIPGKCGVREVLIGINPDGSIKCAPLY